MGGLLSSWWKQFHQATGSNSQFSGVSIFLKIMSDREARSIARSATRCLRQGWSMADPLCPFDVLPKSRSGRLRSAGSPQKIRLIDAVEQHDAATLIRSITGCGVILKQAGLPSFGATPGD
jgi:hypothetical protein